MTDIKTILLVGDNPNDVELMPETLAGYRLANEVIVLNDGEEALGYLYRRGWFAAHDLVPPAIVLLDLKMPKADGMLTSSREERDLVGSYKLGVNAYVVKPVDFIQFVDAVRKLGYFWAVLNERPSAPDTTNDRHE
jgi:CheY-like chemotaxis protein